MELEELRIVEDQCIQENPPPCIAGCPAHVDVRSMCREMGKGDFTAALKVVMKTLPFPGIIGCICEQPCRQVCNRKDAGDAIAIAMLERACAAYGGAVNIKPLPRKGKRVAVAGAGLSSLTVAFDLAKKGFEVTVFDAAGKIGGSIHQYPPEVLPQAVIEKDFKIFDLLGIEFKHDIYIGTDVQFSELCGDFDALYLGLGAACEDNFGLKMEGQRIWVDEITFSSGQEGVFAGGSLLHKGENYSAIRSLSEGRRAAASIDRYLQNVSLTASRAREGAYTSSLYTNMQGVTAQPQVQASQPETGYSQQEAADEARRCVLCECLECVKVCEYLEHYGSYPKQYVREIYNNLSIVMGTRFSNRFINSCALCGLCAEVCPTDVDMGALCMQARQIMVKQNRMPASAHDFALRDMAFSNSEKFYLVRSTPETETSRYLFFPGCQLCASSPQHVESVYAYLADKLSGGVGLALGCCGAPARWAGRTDVLEEACNKFLAEYKRLAEPQVILACSSCMQVFRERMPQVEVLSLWHIMQDYGLPPNVQLPLPMSVSLHDPCTTRDQPDMQDSVRSLLQKLGCRVEELPLSREKTECCSFGGLMWYANRPLAEDVIRRRIEESDLDYVTYCAVCRDFFAVHGKRTLHLLDLLWAGEGEAANHVVPGYSQRRENRARLKNKMLRDIWGENMVEMQAYEKIRLHLSPEVEQRMEDRLILVEDIQRVIESAERLNSKLLNKKNGRYIAYFKPACVTYWVEYAPFENDTYEVFNVYSHRMEIVEDAR